MVIKKTGNESAREGSVARGGAAKVSVRRPRSTHALLPPRVKALHERKAATAAAVDELVRGEWLVTSPEERRFLLPLVTGIYRAELEGRKLSKREAAALMSTDWITTGPKYVKLAEELGLVTIEKKSTEDRRKDFVRPAPSLLKTLDEMIGRLQELDRVETLEARTTTSIESDQLRNMSNPEVIALGSLEKDARLICRKSKRHGSSGGLSDEAARLYLVKRDWSAALRVGTKDREWRAFALAALGNYAEALHGLREIRKFRTISATSNPARPFNKFSGAPSVMLRREFDKNSSIEDIVSELAQSNRCDGRAIDDIIEIIEKKLAQSKRDSR